MAEKKIVDFSFLESIESDLDYVIVKEELEREFEAIIKDPLEGVKLFLEGSAGTWQGRREYSPEVLSFEEFEERRFSGFPCYEIKYNNKGEIKEVEVRVSHHDGTNNYYLTPIQFLNKETLKEFLLDNEDREELNYSLKEGWNETISTASKQDLISYIDFNY